MTMYLAAAIFHFAVADLILPEVYGELSPPDRLIPFHQRNTARSMVARPPRFFDVRTPDNCIFPLEVLLLQDVTASFEDDLKQMINVELDQMFNGLELNHPNSTFSVVSFRDKPISPLGSPEAGDYCQRFDYAPLGNDRKAVLDAYSRMVSTGGGDAPENQFGAMFTSLFRKQIGFGQNPLATRLLIMSTDAPPHFAGDGKNTPNLPPFTGHWSYEEQDEICVAEYYPGPDHIKASMIENEVYGAFLVFDSNWWSGLPYRSWSWFNSYIEQPAEFIHPLAGDASNFWEVLSETLVELSNAECVYQSSTSTSSTTLSTSTTTTSPTTTTATSPGTATTATSPATSTVVTTSSSTTTTTSPATSAVITEKETMPVTCPPCAVEPCDPCAPAVVIRLRERPDRLQLIVENAVGSVDATNTTVSSNV